MATIMPDEKKVRDAIKWVDAGLQEGQDIDALLREVGMRFNLGPKDDEFVYRFFKEGSPKDQDS